MGVAAVWTAGLLLRVSLERPTPRYSSRAVPDVLEASPPASAEQTPPALALSALPAVGLLSGASRVSEPDCGEELPLALNRNPLMAEELKIAAMTTQESPPEGTGIPVGDPGGVDELSAILDEAPSDYHRALAAYALAVIGNGEACSILIARASDPGQQDCLNALLYVQSAYGQETLLHSIQDSTLPEGVRAAIRQTLLRQNSPRVQLVLGNNDVSAGHPEPHSKSPRKEISAENMTDETWF